MNIGCRIEDGRLIEGCRLAVAVETRRDLRDFGGKCITEGCDRYDFRFRRALIVPCGQISQGGGQCLNGQFTIVVREGPGQRPVNVCDGVVIRFHGRLGSDCRCVAHLTAILVKKDLLQDRWSEHESLPVQ